MKNIYLQILQNELPITHLVLATVIRTSGSTPQKAGSSALFGGSGLISGTVGGGVLEGKIQQIACQSLASKKSELFTFRLDNSASDGEDALCGGRIEVLVDANMNDHASVFNAIKRSTVSRIPGVLISTVIKRPGSDVRIERQWITSGTKLRQLTGISRSVFSEAQSILEKREPDNCILIEHAPDDTDPASVVFLEPVFPRPKLVIAGAGHIGKSLAHLGQMLDFEVTVIDDRPEFANRENIPDADYIITDDIGNAIAKLEKSHDTFIVIVTRGHKDDADALKQCLGTEAAYVGMIGSKTKVALMRSDFIAKGWATDQQWSEIFSPVGLDIKSKTVEEIAVSIAAQLIQVKNAKRSTFD